ncbi:unnamed protein product [Adineta steineri]|uniref:LamG-like jellyroll fold domain-containing protein n=1 Tax=Adineta steineri TaxID=433720 RepID=A0A814TUJ5_9BILA|nr:unnamed protein product [Adineta steineri]CAF3980169.1 unnamed protein product [Adineta steineri]
MMTTGKSSTTTKKSSTTTTTAEPGSAATKKSLTTTTPEPGAATTEAAVAYPNGTYSFWPMENNAIDIISGLNGEGVNSPTYVTPGITGSGYALKLIRNNSQYITIPTYKSFVNTSFTVEMWIYPTTLSDSNYFGLFTQYDTSLTDQSLQMMIRGFQLTLDFFADGVTGTTSLTTYNWYHAAFVYDYSAKTQSVYLNGYQDASRVSNQPYLGTSGSINIGLYIDQVLLTMAAKSADDILNDATLVSWYSFDYEITYDSGPNNLQGKAVDVTLAPGKVNQGLNFSLSSSYYKVYGFLLLGTSNHPYSISLWIRRTSTGGGTLVHVSSQLDGAGWCIDFMGFSSSGQIVGSSWDGGTNREVVGPVLPTNVWVHVATTFSTINGVRLYVNGSLIGSTGAFAYVASGLVNTVTLGNPLVTGCAMKSIVSGPFSGYLDEFRVYSRELSAREVSAFTKDKTCFDGLMNGDETDIDCGGSCLTCAAGQKCILTKDCDNAQCTNDTCANATCNDGLQNNGETDVDCGGSKCLPCGTGKACSAAGDCASKNCRSGTCIDSSCQSLTYSPYISYSTGNKPWSISIADLDNDNNNDIIVTNGNDANLGIYFSQGNGTFQTPVMFQTGNYPVFVGSVDLNKDNNLDLIVAQASDNSIGLFLGLGNRSFSSRMNIPVGDYPYGFGTGDFNKDGNLDLVVVNDYDNTASVLFGYGNESFENASTLSTGSYVTAVAVADFNGDSYPDFVDTDYSSDTVSLFINYGNGSFQQRIAYPTGTYPWGIAVADFNHDNYIDVVAVNYYSYTMSVFLGNRDGTLQSQTSYSTGQYPMGIAVADLNNDTHIDIVVANSGSNYLSVFLGYGDGSFTTPTSLTTDWYVSAVAIADLNGDGRLDIAATTTYYETLNILFNIC